jgi:EmrB/QacA subfamily drug resistance transporter
MTTVNLDEPVAPAPSLNPAGSRAIWTVVIAALASFMAGLDNLVVVTALPTIRIRLGGSLQALEWTVNAYTLSFAVLMIMAAALGDRFGRRKVFVVGLLIFTAASAAAASAPGIGELVAARAFQGAGAAAIMPLSLTLLTAAVPAQKRGAALGIYGAVSGLSVAAGPLVGGLIVQHLSWQWIFWVNVPVGLVVAPLALRGLTESRGPRGRLDLVGTLLVSLGLLGLLVGLIGANAKGWTSPAVYGPISVGLVLLAVFVWWEGRAKAPMLPLRMFRGRDGRGFAAVNAGGLLMSLGMYGVIFLTTQFFQTFQGYTPMQAGIRMLAWTAAPAVAAPIGGIVSDRVGAKRVVVTGLAAMFAALVYWALIIDPKASYVAQLPALVLNGAGMGLFYAPLMNLTMETVQVERQGIAAGVSAATRELGAALGVAVLAAVFSGFGGYGSPRQFVDGLEPAMWTGAAALAAATVAMLLIPARRDDADVHEPRATAQN